MAEAIVEILEVVNIDHDQRHGFLVLRASIDLPGKRVLHGVAIAEAGQRIRRRVPFELAQFTVAVGNYPVMAAYPLRQYDQQVLCELVRGVDHLP